MQYTTVLQSFKYLIQKIFLFKVNEDLSYLYRTRGIQLWLSILISPLVHTEIE